jgi:hypothetical protein
MKKERKRKTSRHEEAARLRDKKESEIHGSLPCPGVAESDNNNGWSFSCWVLHRLMSTRQGGWRFSRLYMSGRQMSDACGGEVRQRRAIRFTKAATMYAGRWLQGRSGKG